MNHLDNSKTDKIKVIKNIHTYYDNTTLNF